MSNAPRHAGRPLRVLLSATLLLATLAGSAGTGRASSPRGGAPATTQAMPGPLLAQTTQDETDIAVVQSAGPAIPGTTLVYTLTVVNSSPLTATAVVISDTLPLGYIAGGTGSGCAGTSIVICSLAEVGAMASAVVTLSLELPPEARGVLKNHVAVSTASAESSLDDNAGALETALTPRVDLALVKLDSADPVFAQASYSYTLSVTNNGPSALVPTETLTVTDALPGELRHLGTGADGWSCGSAISPSTTISATSGVSSSVVTCTLAGLELGGAPPIILDVQAPAEGGTITNTARVEADVVDPSLENNAVGETTAITPVADLMLTKTVAPEIVVALRPLTYTLVVKNNGPSTAPGVTLTDTLPLGVAYRSASASQGSCAGGGVVICSVGSIAAGSSVTVTIGARATREGVPTNTASVSSGAFDPTPEDASATTSSTTLAPFRSYLPLVDNPAVSDLVGSFTLNPPGPGLSASDSVLVTVTITNQGNIESVPVWADFYVGPSARPSINQGWDSICGVSPCFGIVWIVPALKPGESITLRSRPNDYDRTYSSWQGWLPAGTSALYLYVDSYNPNTTFGVLEESDEANNISALRGLTVAGPNP